MAPRQQNAAAPVSNAQQPANPVATTNTPMQHIDDKTNQILPEQAWFGAELKKQLPQGATHGDKIYGTGAFAMWGPDLEAIQELQGNRPAKNPYATDSSKLDAYMVKETKRREKEAAKADQLIRNGLIDRDLKPILALPEMSAAEEKKRRTAATNLTIKYDYESSSDEVEDFLIDRTTKPKVKLAKLKQALAKLEQPPTALKAASSATDAAQNSRKRKASETPSDGEEQQASKRSKLDDNHSDQPMRSLPEVVLQGPSLGFQQVTSDPSHPDHGISFSAALEFAMAKELKARTLASWNPRWQSADEAAEATAGAEGRPTRARRTRQPSSGSDQPAATSSGPMPFQVGSKSAATAPPPPAAPSQAQRPATATLPPATAPRPLRITRIFVHPKYDMTSFGMASQLRDAGVGFGDMQTVALSNASLQEEDPSRPFRSQKSLLEVSAMSGDEY